MGTTTEKQYVAFAGATRLAEGTLADVAIAVIRAASTATTIQPLIFDAETGEQIDVDLRGTEEEVRLRLQPVPRTPRPPGRPKLGVVPREVTLLPRHWEWLASQPGGASVTLRKLVDAARKVSGDADQVRHSQEAAYRFMNALAGNEPGFEEATRALFAGDAAGFSALTESWPTDVRDEARRTAAGAFTGATA
ncbi:MAG: DUF2239 domain-containing protein [Actinobacteria bacterium HGW-Actinobacteria-1]|jgi:hypothetical protein|nr:MAG: DUF2239 domain-containing protein [Actinobacteria bacterium HGW-Actinobacteria-1]